MKKNHILYASALAGLLSLASCSNEPSQGKSETPIAVEVAQPLRSGGHALTVSGSVYAKNSAEISTRMMAYVEKVFVKPGQRVKAGQCLIQLNAAELNAKKQQVLAQISTAEIAARNAQKDYERYQKLHQQQSVSDKDLENMKLNQAAMESQLQMARQGLKEVEAMLAYTSINAPFSGVITQKNIDEGSMARPGMPLLVLEQGSDLEIKASVPENHIANVAVGDSVLIEVKSLQEKISGRISELSPSASMNGGQYAMKVAFDATRHPQLLSGMYVAIRLPQSAQESGTSHLLVDKSALVQREQLHGVYVVNADNKAVLRWLRLGKSYGNQVEVLSGLQSGERIIVSAKGKLYNGKAVTVQS